MALISGDPSKQMAFQKSMLNTSLVPSHQNIKDVFCHTSPGEIWDADRLICYMINLPSNNFLSNIQMSTKCILFLMLASGRQKCDIMALDVSPQHMKKTVDAFYCSMNALAKGNQSG